MSLRATLLLGFGIMSVQALAQDPEVTFADDELYEGEEIVVVGQRLAGSVVTDIAPEVQLSPWDIRSFGVSSLADLMRELEPQTSSGRGGRPVMLLNGRRISGFAEIRDLPTEAILRIEVMPEETALRFGYPAEQKVVNIIVRSRFRTVTAELGMSTPTAGGQTSFDAESMLLRINKDGRLNISLNYKRSSALYEDERNLTPERPRQPYDLTGNITSATPGAEIDPALSAIVGSPVLVAGVPAGAGEGTNLGLADFANSARVSDVGVYRTLLPETDSVGANAVLNRTVFGDVSATVTAGITYDERKSMQGLATANLLVPTGSPFSPFGNDINLYRYLGEYDPLQQRNWSVAGNFGLSLNGNAGNWMWTATATYDITHSRTTTDRGVGLDAFQSRIASLDPDINPFAPITGDLLGDSQIDRARSTEKSGKLTLLASGSPFMLPAGNVLTSFTLDGQIQDLNAWSERRGVFSSADLSRDTISGQANISLPISSRREDVLAAIGDLSANFNVAVNHISDFRTLRDLTYGLNWSPIKPVSLILSFTDEEQAPSMQQLGNPLIVTTGVRMFDYVRGETVDVQLTSGGNPLLDDSRTHTLKLGVMAKPFDEEDLRININYLRQKTDRPTMNFPAATAVIEAAFSSRFTRDANGQLTAVDARPVNLHARKQEEVRWGFNYSKMLTNPPAPEPRGDASAGGPPAGGPGFGRRGGGRGGQGLRIYLSLYHTIALKDKLEIHSAGPVLDLLGRDAIGSSGGQSRHQVEAQLGLMKSGFGGRLSAGWQSGTTVAGGMAGDTLDFSSLKTVDLRLFANLGQQQSLVSAVPFLQGSRVSLSVSNIFNERMRVRDSLGQTPISFQPAYMDALGRTVSISFRKMFLPPRRQMPPPTPAP